MDHFIVRKTTVIGRPIYRCRKCDAVASGDMVTVEQEGQLITSISKNVATPHAMPVGWASYQGPTFECPKHHE